MEETSERATEEGSLSQDEQTCARCLYVHNQVTVFMMYLLTVFHLFFPPDFARAVAARPISYAAVLRMKADSSSVLHSRSRPRQHHSGGLVTTDWPAFSGHPLSALSLLSSQEDYRSEGKPNGVLHPHTLFALV